MTTPLVDYLNKFDALPWNQLDDDIRAAGPGAQEFYLMARHLKDYRDEPDVAAALNAQRTAEA